MVLCLVLVVVDGSGREEGFLTCSQVAFEAFAHAVHKSPAYVDTQQHHLQQNRTGERLGTAHPIQH